MTPASSGQHAAFLSWLGTKLKTALGQSVLRTRPGLAHQMTKPIPAI